MRGGTGNQEGNVSAATQKDVLGLSLGLDVLTVYLKRKNWRYEIKVSFVRSHILFFALVSQVAPNLDSGPAYLSYSYLSLSLSLSAGAIFPLRKFPGASGRYLIVF